MILSEHIYETYLRFKNKVIIYIKLKYIYFAYLGILVLAIIVSFSIYLTFRMRTVQAQQLKKKDCRIQRIFETLINLKVLKLHVWESTFERIVGLLRLDELISVRTFITLQAFQGFIWNSAISLVAFASFSAYSILVAPGKDGEGQSSLSAQTVFVSIALLNTMRSAFRLMPSCVTAWSQSSASIKRIDDFLNSEHNLAPKYRNSFPASITKNSNNSLQQSSSIYTYEEKKSLRSDKSQENTENSNVGANTTEMDKTVKISKHTAIVLKDCNFAINEITPCMENDKESISTNKNNDNDITNGYCYVDRPSQPSLTNISMCVEKGEIIGVVGAMASGKSTLVSALIGELTKTKGTFVVTDKLINVPNVPWLKSGTIRDNILFGSSSDCGDGIAANSSAGNTEQLAAGGGSNRRPKLYEKVRSVLRK